MSYNKLDILIVSMDESPWKCKIALRMIGTSLLLLSKARARRWESTL